MTRPLRLGTREAVVLVAALRAMAAALGPSLDPERARVLGSALEKLTAATGEAAAAVDVRLAVDGSPAVVAAIGTALQTGRRLRLREQPGPACEPGIASRPNGQLLPRRGMGDRGDGVQVHGCANAFKVMHLRLEVLQDQRQLPTGVG